jgi:hypothetical protein
MLIRAYIRAMSRLHPRILPSRISPCFGHAQTCNVRAWRIGIIEGDFWPATSWAAFRAFYDEDVADKVLTSMAAGGSLAAACREHGVPVGRVATWAVRNADFRRKYFDAFAARMIVEADRILEIADGPGGEETMAGVTARKLAYDARRWLSSRLLGELADRTEPGSVPFAGAEIKIYLPAKGGGQVIDGQAVELLENRSDS